MFCILKVCLSRQTYLRYSRNSASGSLLNSLGSTGSFTLCKHVPQMPYVLHEVVLQHQSHFLLPLTGQDILIWSISAVSDYLFYYYENYAVTKTTVTNRNKYIVCFKSSCFFLDITIKKNLRIKFTSAIIVN